MREIKFRAFIKSDKEMTEVLSLDFVNHAAWVLTDYTGNYGSSNTLPFAGIELMQYTGLKDKNGVEIYEGDILDRKYLWVVTWKNNGWYGVVATKYHHNDARIEKIIKNRKRACVGIEVIGNIHENPELLEVEK